MHFAFPPRKTSHPPAYARRNNAPTSYLRNPRLRLIGTVACSAAALLWLVLHLTSGSDVEYVPHGTPGAVVITMFNTNTAKAEPDIKRAIVANRISYAERHDYRLNGSPVSWSLIPSLRHAMTLYPHTSLFFYLAPSALIMQPDLTLESHIMSPRRLESLMVVDQPIVPPDSVIKTFRHLKGDKVDFVLSQDAEGLAVDSMLLRKGDWAKYFLDAWFDPLYRSYNFQKAELHALEHLVQWHGTILAKLALVPQRTINAYKFSKDPKRAYQAGDFVLNFGGCERDPKRSCAKEMRPTLKQMGYEVGSASADADADTDVAADDAAAAGKGKRATAAGHVARDVYEDEDGNED